MSNMALREAVRCSTVPYSFSQLGAKPKRRGKEAMSSHSWSNSAALILPSLSTSVSPKRMASMPYSSRRAAESFLAVASVHHARKEFLSYLQVSEPQGDATAAKLRVAVAWRRVERATVDNMVNTIQTLATERIFEQLQSSTTEMPLMPTTLM